MGGSITKNIKRGAVAGVTGGLSEFMRKDPFGGIRNPVGAASLYRSLGGKALGDENLPQAISGPFNLDMAQFDSDRSAINSLGEKQYADTLSAIDSNAEAQQKYAGQTIDRMLPDIYEDMNSRHLLQSTALPTEIARQVNSSAQDIASQRSNAIQQALVGKQGFETGALQRGLSLEDFVNQANVSKSIGAAFAPQAPTGKQNFGTVAQGVGALSPIAGLAINAAGKTGGGGGGSGGGGIPNGQLSLFGGGSGYGRYT